MCLCLNKHRWCRVLRLILHILIAAHFWFACYYDYTFTYEGIPPEQLGFGGRFKYLSFWNGILQSIFYTICVTNDIFGSNDLDPVPKSRIRQMKDYYQSALSFPFAIYVGVIFWIFIFFFTDKIIPPDYIKLHAINVGVEIATNYPQWLMHVLHTNIIIFAILEMFISYCQYTSKLWCGLIGTIIFMLIYDGWVILIYYHDQKWVYVGQFDLNLIEVAIGFIVCLIFITILYFIGALLNYLVSGMKLKKLRSENNSAESQNLQECEQTKL